MLNFHQALKRKTYECDLCVVGGGLSGLCCAIAAARHGKRVILIQDRAVLGGNASSEVRMHVCGSQGKGLRETGIIEELILSNYASNPGLKYPLWDAVLYDAAIREANLTLLLNTSVLDCECENGIIRSVTGWQSNAETVHTVTATYFADCSGDSILAPLTGAAYRYGREAKAEFDERIPPEKADAKTMGMSCLMQFRETDHHVDFAPPSWAYVYPTDDDLPFKDHLINNNFWWIEIGGTMDCVHDTDACREELLKIAYGVIDHIKNRGDHGADNWELEWVGLLPGKRESRRYVGEITVSQNDVEAGGRFPDVVGYAGWTMDDHFPEGFYYRDGYPTIFHPAPHDWGIPLRALISKSVKNLVFAGRNISVTHAALSSSRVMATCAILGQAIGTAVAEALDEQKDVREIDVPRLQQTLMDDDCYLPGFTRTVSPLSLAAECNAPVVRNGHDRFDENLWIGKPGDALTYTLDRDTEIASVRIVFDSNLAREGQNMPSNYALHRLESKMPETLIRAFTVRLETDDGTVTEIPVSNNAKRFLRIPIGGIAKKISLVPTATWGSPDLRVFSFEIE